MRQQERNFLFRRLPIHKTQRILLTNDPNPTRLIMKRDSVTFVRNQNHLWSERRADELPARLFFVSFFVLIFVLCLGTGGGRALGR